MDPVAFKAVVGTPQPGELAAALGSAAPLWEQLLATLQTQFGPLTPEWKKYSKAGSWTLRLLQKKRNLTFLTPADPPRATVMLGDKAVANALAAELPADLRQQVQSATRYPEGTAVYLTVEQPGGIEAVAELIRHKLAAAR